MGGTVNLIDRIDTRVPQLFFQVPGCCHEFGKDENFLGLENRIIFQEWIRVWSLS